jgi:hypothetical protein
MIAPLSEDGGIVILRGFRRNAPCRLLGPTIRSSLSMQIFIDMSPQVRCDKSTLDPE